MSLILRVFRKNCMVLIYLFIFVDFLMSFFNEEASHCCFEIIEDRIITSRFIIKWLRDLSFLTVFYSFCSRETRRGLTGF